MPTASNVRSALPGATLSSATLSGTPTPLLARVAGLIAAAPDPDAFGPAAVAAICDAYGAVAGAIVRKTDGMPTVRWSSGPAGAEPWARPGAVSRAVPGTGIGAGPDTLVLIASGAGASSDAELDAVLALVGAVVGPADRARTLAGEAEVHAAGGAAERHFAAAVIDALPVGVYVTDREHRVRLWNRKRELDTLGVAREAALGRTVFDLLPRQDAELMRGELDAVLATGRLQQIDTESRASGEARTYRLSKIPMALDAAEPTHVITVGEDVTEWKAALGRTAQAEKLAAVGQLAAGVMHEINNPLGTIAACAETMTLDLAELPRERHPAGFGEYLRIIDHEVHRCRRIVDGLLNFSRARDLRRPRVSIDAVLEETLGLLRHHARFKHCPVRLDLGGQPGADGTSLAVLGDPDQLTQVAMALLLNAADAVAAVSSDAARAADDPMPRGVTVRTRSDLTEHGAAVVMEIADDGIGMSREVAAKIFDPFFTTKVPGEGTGLGLAICYGLVRDLGGTIDVESTPGTGTTFRVTFPAA